MSLSPSVGADDELDELAARYAHRAEFFAGRVARRFRLGMRWHDELVSAAYWGLFKALRNRRKDAHERELSAYVSRRIEGAVLDEVRTCLTRCSHQDVLGGNELGDDAGAFDRILQERRDLEPPNDPEQATNTHMRWERVVAACSVLTQEQQRVLLAYACGSSVSEIAADEGLPPATLKQRFDKITRQIRGASPQLRRVLRDEELP